MSQEQFLAVQLILSSQICSPLHDRAWPNVSQLKRWTLLWQEPRIKWQIGKFEGRNCYNLANKPHTALPSCSIDIEKSKLLKTSWWNMTYRVPTTMVNIFMPNAWTKKEIGKFWDWNILRYPHKSINNFRTKRKIKNRRHGFSDQPFGMGHGVVPPTFHRIRLYAISSRRLGNF